SASAGYFNRIGGTVYGRRLQVDGHVLFDGTEIGGDLNMIGAAIHDLFYSATGPYSAKVHRTVYLDRIQVTGTVKMEGLIVGVCLFYIATDCVGILDGDGDVPAWLHEQFVVAGRTLSDEAVIGRGVANNRW